MTHKKPFGIHKKWPIFKRCIVLNVSEKKKLEIKEVSD